MGDMTGQVALVTGGVRGIGRAICERLYARGVKVAAGYSGNKEAAEKFCADHPGSSVHQGNIGVAEDCERVIREVLDTHGRMDILVNNAGITADMVAAVPKEALDKVVAKIPVGRLGEPDEIARMVEFLADPDSGFITGQIFSVNGGQYM